VADKGTGMFVQEAAIVLWMGGSGGWWVVGCEGYRWFGLDGKPSHSLPAMTWIQTVSTAN
jgi:hypothetical protein